MEQNLKDIIDQIQSRNSTTWIITVGDPRLSVPDVDTPKISIPEDNIPQHWFIEIPRAMAKSGVKKILIYTWGWWISHEPAPDHVEIADHIACHLPSPLTGTEDARYGRAFIDMRGAYESLNGNGVILWHTKSIHEITPEEIEHARKAGCAVVCGLIAPWAVGAKANGCLFSAVLSELKVWR